MAEGNNNLRSDLEMEYVKSMDISNKVQKLLDISNIQMRKGISMFLLGVNPKIAFKDLFETHLQIIELIGRVESDMVRMMLGVKFLNHLDEFEKNFKPVNN